MSKVKTYCYKKECAPVETGFQFVTYWSCKVCKEEISDSLRQSIASRDEPKVDTKPESNYRTEEELLDLWAMDGGITANLFGDDI